MYDVIVIGGGPAGMMAAGRAAERGRRVLLLEKNHHLGMKLSITGGGRCNICNAEEDVHRLLSHYGEESKFLYSSFSQFGMTDTMRFFTSRGMPIKVEAHQRAFPETENAEDVVKLLEQYLADGGVTVRTGTAVNGWAHDQQKITGVRIGDEVLTAEAYILATGGTSHPETGSTGDGFRWLSELGHTVTPPSPTVVPLAVADAWVKSLAGVTMADVKITFYVDQKKRLAKSGRILCTHFGLSGPLILNSAAQVSDFLHDGTVTATIDTYPSMDLGTLDAHIVRTFEDNKNRDLKNVMKVLAPTGTAAAVLTLCPDIPAATKVHSITKDQRKALGRLLKELPMTILGLMGEDRAVVTDGGIVTREVDGKTMQSRLFSNLYVTGDVIHIRRPSGGYSLQLCWTTGWVAGSHVSTASDDGRHPRQ